MELTSVAAADQVGEVGESLVAVVSLAAAEEDLRVFLHGNTLLPITKSETLRAPIAKHRKQIHF